MKNLLVPVDGSVYAMQAVEKAKKIAAAFKSNIVLVTVSAPRNRRIRIQPLQIHPDRQQKSSVDRIERRKKAQAVLDCAKAPLAGLDGKIETVILEGNPAEMILQYAQKNQWT
jgi:nucleotide-binding universal stress UspA family protein